MSDIETTRKGDWMQTFSGKRFYPLDSRPEDVDIRDIAHHLAMLCRFGGAVREFYSVAEHSVRASYLVPPQDRLWTLLHDAPEAYIGDMVRPLKRQPEMETYRCAEEGLMGVICLRFGLGLDPPPSVREADEIMLATEARDLMGNGCVQTWREMRKPLADIINPWSWSFAKRRFRERFEELSGKAEEPQP